MNGLQEYWLPYSISQVVGVVILLLALKNSRWGRWAFLLVFCYAGIYNLYIGIYRPDEYLNFSKHAIPLYRNLINGWFTQNNHWVIPAIAIGQLSIAFGMGYKGKWVKWACAGAILFLLAIAPLGVGSAFPFSIIVSCAAVLIWKNDSRSYLITRSKRKSKLLRAKY